MAKTVSTKPADPKPAPLAGAVAAAAKIDDVGLGPFSSKTRERPISSFLIAETPELEKDRIREVSVLRISPQAAQRLINGDNPSVNGVSEEHQNWHIRWKGRQKAAVEWELAGREYCLNADSTVSCFTYARIQWPDDWRETLYSVSLPVNGSTAVDHEQQSLIRIRQGRFPIYPVIPSLCTPCRFAQIYSANRATLYHRPPIEIATSRFETQAASLPRIARSDYMTVELHGDLIFLNWFASAEERTGQELQVNVREWHVLQTRTVGQGLRMVCHTQDGNPIAQVTFNDKHHYLTIGATSEMDVTSARC